MLPEQFFFSRMNMLLILGHPKLVNYFYIPLINREITWVSRKSAEDRGGYSGGKTKKAEHDFEQNG